MVKGSSHHDEPEVLHQSVVETESLSCELAELCSRFVPDVLVVGDGTTSSAAAEIARATEAAPVELVDEKHSSEVARRRFFQLNPPRGWRRLVPTSLQTPPVPYDDYVAVVLAERYLDLRDQSA